MTLDANAAELDRAETEAENAGDEFEDALKRLKDAVMHTSRPEVESFVRRRVEGIRDEATRVLNEDPLLAWSVIFAAGVLAGAWITSFPRKGSLSDPG
jgi:hypothetical protein